MRKPIIAIAVLFAISLAAGCGGGGGGSSPIPTTGGAGGFGGSTNASVAIVIPAKAPSGSKSPAYVSASTRSVRIVVTPQGGTAYPAVVANVPGTYCIGGPETGYTCTIVVTATFGTDTLDVTAFDGANATGNVLSHGTLTTTFASAPSPAPIDITLAGTIKTVVLSFASGADASGYAPIGAPVTLDVVAKDAGGNTIVGTYDAPIALTLSANPGVSSSKNAFPDSTGPSTNITWNGAPTYYNAPTSAVTITATAGGGAVTAAIALHPLTTLLSFAAGSGGSNAAYPVGLVHDGASFALALGSYVSPDGELASFDPTTGAQSTKSSLGFYPNSLYRDPKFGGIWISDYGNGLGTLHCYTSPASSDVPLPIPTAGSVDPYQMAADGANRLWFTAGDGVGYANLTAQCAATLAQPYISLPYDTTSPYAVGIGADRSADNLWVGDVSNSRADLFQGGSFSTPGPDFSFNANAMGYDGAGNLVFAGSEYDESSGAIQTVPSGSTSPGAMVNLFYGANFAAMDAVPTGNANAPMAFADYNGSLDLYYPGATALSTVVPIAGNYGIIVGDAKRPARARVRASVKRASQLSQGGDCEGVAFDGNAQPWVLCAGPSGAAVVDRLIVTDAWNAFEAIDALHQFETGSVGVAGGAAGTTFAATCSGAVTCTQDESFPRVFSVYAAGTGAGTVRIDGSDGRSVAYAITVAGQIVTSTH